MLEDRSLPSTFMVVDLLDSGAGSLRNAIVAANANPGANVIDFTPGLQGTILLSSELDITNSVSINGPGANLLAVSGKNATRVISVPLLRPAAGAAAACRHETPMPWIETRPGRAQDRPSPSPPIFVPSRSVPKPTGRSPSSRPPTTAGRRASYRQPSCEHS